MRSEALDITISSKGTSIWLFLSGPFHSEQAPGMKEKITGLIDDGSRKIIIDMENVTDIDDTVPQMFLYLVNLVRGKGGDIAFIFKNEIVTKAFSSNKNLFAIYPDAGSLPLGGFFKNLKRRSQVLTRKTGIRLSRPIAITFLISLAGWILTLFFIIHLQNVRIRQQEVELRTITAWKRDATIELNTLHERMKPLEQLGIFKENSSR